MESALSSEDKENLSKLAKKLGYSFESLTLQDIEAIEIADKSIIKFINSYRISLMFQKIEDVGHEAELLGQINLCSTMCRQLKDLDKLRLKAIKSKEKLQK